MALRDIYARHEERRAPPAREETAMEAPPSLFAVLWRRKLTILATLLAFLVGGLAYVLVTPPRYLASTSILIDPRLGKSVGNDPLQPGYIPDTSAIDSQIKLFTSQTVLERVARMADLENVPEFNGSQRSFLQRLMHPTLGADEKVDLRALEDAITIKRPERTYVVAIEVLARNPQLSADIANDITKAYIDDQVSSRVGAAQGDASFVKDKLATLSMQIKAAEDRVEAYKVKNGIVDTAGLRSNEQQVSDLTRSLSDARAKASDAKAALAEIDSMARSGHLDAISEALRSQTIERYRQAQAETDQTVAKLAQTLGPSHPELMEARARQRELSTLIRAELKRLRLSAQQDYQVARLHERQIVAGVDGLKAQSTRMSSALPALDVLERNVKLLRASFDRFSQVNDTLSQQEGESPPGRVIAVARPPVSPARPKKTLVAVISLAGGLFFGMAAALFAESVSAPLPRPVPEPTPRDARAPAPLDARERVPRYADPETRYEREMRRAAGREPLPPEPSRPRARARRYWDDDDA